jgi:hypothetical protein
MNMIRIVVCCICMYVFFCWLNTHAPLQSSNTTCFIVHLCYFFVVGDAVTSSSMDSLYRCHCYNVTYHLKYTISAVIREDRNLSIL